MLLLNREVCFQENYSELDKLKAKLKVEIERLLGRERKFVYERKTNREREKHKKIRNERDRERRYKRKKEYNY